MTNFATRAYRKSNLKSLLRPRRESNPRIFLLQRNEFPLFYVAVVTYYTFRDSSSMCWRFFSPLSIETSKKGTLIILA